VGTGRLLNARGRGPENDLAHSLLTTYFIRNSARTAKSLLEIGLRGKGLAALAERLKTNQEGKLKRIEIRIIDRRMMCPMGTRSGNVAGRAFWRASATN
jgi:hypothetical protein